MLFVQGSGPLVSGLAEHALLSLLGNKHVEVGQLWRA